MAGLSLRELVETDDEDYLSYVAAVVDRTVAVRNEWTREQEAGIRR